MSRMIGKTRGVLVLEVFLLYCQYKIYYLILMDIWSKVVIYNLQFETKSGNK